MPSSPSKILEVFDNPNIERDFVIRIDIPEFTCLCPKTGQPDFATLHLEYIADKSCVELKALKNYIWSFRNEGAFHEAVTNQIFNVRGGIYTTVESEHKKDGWLPRDVVSL